MSCYHPMMRIEDYAGKVNIVSKADFDNDIVYHNEYIEKQKLGRNSAIWKRADVIPCGSCIGCRLDYAREWANRITIESKCYPKEKNWFITLTYNDENLPYKEVMNQETGESIKGTTLYKKHIQDFMKRLRKAYPDDTIRFYCAGEYGDQTQRPHYHACIFNISLEQELLKKYKNNEQGDAIFTHEKLEKIWGKGFVTVAELSWETASYTARYVMKKQIGAEARTYYIEKAKEPEFVQMSLRPGIGYPYYKEHKNEIYKNDEITIPQKKGARKIKPPKYFDMLREKEEPEEMKKLKLKRRRNSERNEYDKYFNNKLEPQFVREIAEREKMRQAKSLVREI